jgi:hypothetical protein
MVEYKAKVTDTVTKWYNEYNQLHRQDGPAVEYVIGGKEYFINGVRHREDGPAIEWADGYKAHYINGKLHRENGPAVEYANGDKFYFINGLRHREDGPAIEGADGYKCYYIKDIEITKEEFDNRNKSCIDKIVEIERVKYKLTKI